VTGEPPVEKSEGPDPPPGPLPASDATERKGMEKEFVESAIQQGSGGEKGKLS